MKKVAAQRRLDHGKRMVELLKQPQFSPLSVGEEVVTILAGSSGLLDDIGNAEHVCGLVSLADTVRGEARQAVAAMKAWGMECHTYTFHILRQGGMRSTPYQLSPKLCFGTLFSGTPQPHPEANLNSVNCGQTTSSVLSSQRMGRFRR